MSASSAMRVAIVGTNDPRNFSGGRYHGLIMAYAVAAFGGDVHVITDHKPAFVRDLEPLAPGRVVFHQTRDFVGGLPDGGFDWVFVIPTGIFLPNFYECCLDFAAQSGARLGLVNFESGNWFNALAPEPRDARLWDYWRRICLGGALLLSSARTSDQWARAFYHAPDGHLRFEVWYPPINSEAARRFEGVKKDGSLLAFVRPQDAHKGSGMLTELDPALYAGRTLRLISGRDLPKEFTAAISDHLRRTSDARLEVCLRVSDIHKYRLLSCAQAVLFPTHFEGYGYPPIEAAYAGTESACFDLPVLKETVGSIAHFAPQPTLAGFEAAVAAALAMPERRQELRAAINTIADFQVASTRLAEILTRSADSVAPVAQRRFWIAVGPFARTPPLPSEKVDRAAPLPTFPPYVVSATHTTAGEVVITCRAQLPASVERLEATDAGGTVLLPSTWDAGPANATGLRDFRIYLVAPKEIIGHRLMIQGYRDNQSAGKAIELEVERVAPASRLLPVIAGISENDVEQDQRKLRGWVLAREPVTTLCFTARGKTWLRFPVGGERRDVFAKNPGYPSPRCEFSVRVPLDEEPHRADSRLICLAGPPGQEQAIDTLASWPPAPKPYFTESVTLSPPPGPVAPAPGAVVAAKARPAGTTEPKPRRPQFGSLELIDRTDETWLHGVARSGSRDRLGCIHVRKTEILGQVAPGVVLRFASGITRRAVSIEHHDHSAGIVLDGPLDPQDNGFPAPVGLFAADWEPKPVASLVIPDWTDQRWWRGIWNKPDERYRRGLTVKTNIAVELGVATGTRLRLSASGLRRVVAHDDDAHNNRRLWLDGPIRPMGDGAPNPVMVDTPVGEESGSIPFSLAREDAGWPRGILGQTHSSAQAGQAVLLDSDTTSQIARGSVLRFARETLMRVVSVTPEPDGLVVILDGLLDPEIHGHPANVQLIDPADMPDGVKAGYGFPEPRFKAKDPLHVILAANARRQGAAVRARAPTGASKRRVLVLSLVSPYPANQGNRVVTRNLTQHLVDSGFACDIVIQNWVDAAEVHENIGPDTRILTVPFPEWQASEPAMQRRAFGEAARNLARSPLDEALGAAVERAAEYYHPYFIVRDATVDLARTLFAQHRYDAIICNYTHMLRVAVELQTIRPLPPVAVFTHDALSRLPREFNGQRLDLMYRACTATLERDVLDSIPGAVVVAISRSEAEYFRRIGTRNTVVVTEYDAAEEMEPFQVDTGAFERRTIIFHGSANPMNIAGLNWFVDECWSSILTAVPGAKLVVCGSAGRSWAPKLPGIEIIGELTRGEMLRRCAEASMTINPCVAGTGLKIKTVEAVCLGLPAVCLPLAVDGLEDIADRFAVIARDEIEFTAGCITLLSDRERWTSLHDGALEAARTRFSSQAVYQALDEAMGWGIRSTACPGAASEESESTLSDVADPVPLLEANPNDQAALFTLGKRLLQANQRDAGWEIVNRVATYRRGDPKVAAQAARLALQIGEYWRAVVHAATVIGEYPALPEGYALMGEALLGCKLPHDAVVALEQGILIAPEHQRLLVLLEEALIRAGREADAAIWRARRAPDAEFGQYVTLDGPHIPKFVEGFLVEGDGNLSIRSGKGTVRIVLPWVPANRISLSLDVRRPIKLDQDVAISLGLHKAACKHTISAYGPAVQTMSINADLTDEAAVGTVSLSLEILKKESLAFPLQLIGYLLEADRQSVRS